MLLGAPDAAAAPLLAIDVDDGFEAVGVDASESGFYLRVAGMKLAQGALEEVRDVLKCLIEEVIPIPVGEGPRDSEVARTVRTWLVGRWGYQFRARADTVRAAGSPRRPSDCPRDIDETLIQ